MSAALAVLTFRFFSSVPRSDSEDDRANASAGGLELQSGKIHDSAETLQKVSLIPEFQSGPRTNSSG
jgi:hypothetical protein